MDPEALLDMERSVRFFYLLKLAFGAKISGQNFGVSIKSSGRFNTNRIHNILEDFHFRMAGVVIECLPFQEFIPRYDRKKTLFYLDPPYFGNEDDYGKDVFSRSDFEKLAVILGSIKGRFIMSLNDRPEVRKIFANFKISSVKTTYTVARNNGMKAGEVLITN